MGCNNENTSQRICHQSNIPELEEEDIKCDGCFHLTDCVIYEDAVAYFGLPANSDLTVLLNAMMSSLIDARNRIQILENS